MQQGQGRQTALMQQGKGNNGADAVCVTQDEGTGHKQTQQLQQRTALSARLVHREHTSPQWRLTTNACTCAGACVFASMYVGVRRSGRPATLTEMVPGPHTTMWLRIGGVVLMTSSMMPPTIWSRVEAFTSTVLETFASSSSSSRPCQMTQTHDRYHHTRGTNRVLTQALRSSPPGHKLVCRRHAVASPTLPHPSAHMVLARTYGVQGKQARTYVYSLALEARRCGTAGPVTRGAGTAELSSSS